MKPVLRVRDLTMSYTDGKEVRSVLDGFQMTAARGEIVALMGPSGSGKSTLLNLLAGILVADCGHITLQVGGEAIDYASLTRDALTRLRRRHIGYVFQFFNLVPTLTVRENVLLPLELNGRMDLKKEAFARLETLGLGDRMNDFPANLSGGERQRTAIARALAHRPALVLADEPTGNLDADNAARVVELLVSEVKSLPCTLVIATHNPRVADAADCTIHLGR
ncbi:MAG: ABC transporter ATP-binding protein [Gammaproteobacteria bacterium]